jgi:MFS family permease
MQESYDRGEKNWVLGVTSLASFMMALDALVITTAFATIRADFGASVETLQWAINAFNLTFAVLLLTGAALGDRFGRGGCLPEALRCSCWRRQPVHWPVRPYG